MNAPYNFAAGNHFLLSGDQILERLVQLGVSAVELRSQPVELFLGSPTAVAAAEIARAAAAARAAGGGTAGARPGGAGTGRGRATATPEQEAAARAAAEDLRKWRLSVPISRVREFRKRYEDAGVAIEIVKFDGIYTLTDDVLDYSFELAKNLGARAVSCELSLPDTKRLGQFANKHKMKVGYHGHAAATQAMFEEAFSYSPANCANLDLGHFVAGQNTSPVPFLKQHHARITHVHVKDRKFNNGPDGPFGTGDTPIKEVLQLIRDNKWPIQATLEYAVRRSGRLRPDEGNGEVPRVTCKNCLLG